MPSNGSQVHELAPPGPPPRRGTGARQGRPNHPRPGPRNPLAGRLEEKAISTVPTSGRGSRSAPGPPRPSMRPTPRATGRTAASSGGRQPGCPREGCRSHEGRRDDEGRNRQGCVGEGRYREGRGREGCVGEGHPRRPRRPGRPQPRPRPRRPQPPRAPPLPRRCRPAPPARRPPGMLPLRSRPPPSRSLPPPRSCNPGRPEARRREGNSGREAPRRREARPARREGSRRREGNSGREARRREARRRREGSRRREGDAGREACRRGEADPCEARSRGDSRPPSRRAPSARRPTSARPAAPGPSAVPVESPVAVEAVAEAAATEALATEVVAEVAQGRRARLFGGPPACPIRRRPALYLAAALIGAIGVSGFSSTRSDGPGDRHDEPLGERRAGARHLPPSRPRGSPTPTPRSGWASWP